MERKKLDILFVIVLYKTKLKQSLTYLSLRDSLERNGFFGDLVVYNNSAAEFTEAEINNTSNFKIISINDINNSGVSKAYNTAAEVAQKMRKKWMLLLDQDTNFPINAIDKYLLAISKYPNEKLFAPVMTSGAGTIISPCYFRYMRGVSVNNIITGISNLNKYSVINCGMCVALDAFIQNGGYNEAIKLDFSDHDFIRRFRTHVADEFVVIDLVVAHQLSSETKNTYGADRTRFDYYLSGGKLLSDNKIELINFKFNALIRALKLAAFHKNLYFIGRLFS